MDFAAQTTQTTRPGARVAYWRNTGKGAYKYGQIFEGAVYQATARKSDGLLTWRLVGTFGGSRSGKSCPSLRYVAELKGRAAAAKLAWGFARYGVVCP